MNCPRYALVNLETEELVRERDWAATAYRSLGERVGDCCWIDTHAPYNRHSRSVDAPYCSCEMDGDRWIRCDGCEARSIYEDQRRLLIRSIEPEVLSGPVGSEG